MALEKTAGLGITTPSPRYQGVRQSSLTSAISNMQKLGSQLGGVMQEQAQVDQQRQAMNDLVNDTINPDKKLHQAAYSSTVAKGEALQGYNTVREGVANGDYDEVDPEIFQDTLKSQHKDYGTQWEGNSFAGEAMSEYNKFWLKNESTITAAQAGKFRVKLGEKQGIALSKELSEFASQGVTPESYPSMMAIVESPEYSLLNQDHRIFAALAAGAEIGENTGNDSLLIALNEEYGLDVSKQFGSAFDTAMKLTNRKKNTVAQGEELQLRVSLRKLADAGGLTQEMFGPTFEGKRGINGELVVSAATFARELTRSKDNGVTIQEQRIQTNQFQAGINLGTTQKKFDAVADKEEAIKLQEFAGDPLLVAEHMGAKLVQQADTWSKMKDLGTLFSSQAMMIGNEPNEAMMNRFDVISAFNKGLSANAEGKYALGKYLGVDSLNVFHAIEEELSLGNGDLKAAWSAVSQSRDLVKQATERDRAFQKRSPEIQEKAKDIAESVMKRTILNWVPDAFWGRHHDEGANIRRIAGVAGQVYEKSKAQGSSDAVATRTAMVTAAAETTTLWGNKFDTHKIPMAKVLNTHEPDKAMDTFFRDPIVIAELGPLFNTFGFKGETKKDILVGLKGFKHLPVTPEEIRERDKIYASKTWKWLDTKQAMDNMSINMSTGNLEFRSPVDGGKFIEFPAALVGRIHEALLNGTEELTDLDRYYEAAFIGTKEGRKWVNDNADMNAEFQVQLNEGLEIQYSTAEEYSGLPEKEKTRVRKKFHKSEYSGATGTMREFRDYYKYKADLDAGVTPDVTLFPITGVPQVLIRAGAGIQNNNPGNLRFAGQEGATGEKGKGFAKFKTPEAGYKALVKDVEIKQSGRSKTGITGESSLSDMIRVYAPESENDTVAYIKYMSAELGVSADTKIEDINSEDIAKAIAKYESDTVIQ